MHQVINFNETAKLQAKENLNAYILKYQNNFIIINLIIKLFTYLF